MTQKMINRGMERMKVYKTLSHWRKEYSVFYNRDADNTGAGNLFAYPSRPVA